MRTFLGGAGFGLSLGFLLGWLFFSGPSGGPAPTTRGPDSSAPSPARRKSSARAPVSAKSTSTDSGARKERPTTTYAQAERRIAELQAELAAVGTEADEARETLDEIREEARKATEKEHARIPFPEDLPERFGQENLMQSVNQALEAFGGEISAVDCTEYPCIVYADLPGRGVPPPVEFKSFMGDPAMRSYAEDSRMHFAYDDTDEVGNHLARHTGFTFFPKSSSGDTSSEELGERVHRRVREWRKAAAPLPESD